MRAIGVFPTRTLKGIVFVWMGQDEREPAPIEEDVPEEFFDPRPAPAAACGAVAAAGRPTVPSPPPPGSSGASPYGRAPIPTI
ncbi:MAG TPA: hypothetical protein VKV26_10660 [Dehalococcoidia bacterium]|nr:hypothetical protein [Dehalococcoidia bacterium]